MTTPKTPAAIPPAETKTAPLRGSIRQDKFSTTLHLACFAPEKSKQGS